MNPSVSLVSRLVPSTEPDPHHHHILECHRCLEGSIQSTSRWFFCGKWILYHIEASVCSSLTEVQRGRVVRMSATAEWLCGQTDVLMPARAPHHMPWANGLTYTSVHLKWGTTKRLLWTANDSECKASSVPTRTEQPIKVGHPDSPSISDHQLQADLSSGSIQNRSGPATFLWPGWRQRSPLAGTGIPWRYCWFSFRPLQ